MLQFIKEQYQNELKNITLAFKRIDTDYSGSIEGNEIDNLLRTVYEMTDN